MLRTSSGNFYNRRTAHDGQDERKEAVYYYLQQINIATIQ
jgi:hypothetical protein